MLGHSGDTYIYIHNGDLTNKHKERERELQRQDGKTTNMGQGFGYTGADSASFVKTAGWPANWSGPNLLWKRSPPIHVYRSIGDDKQSFLGELRVYNPRLRSFQTRTVFPPNQGLWKPKLFFTTFLWSWWCFGGALDSARLMSRMISTASNTRLWSRSSGCSLGGRWSFLDERGYDSYIYTYIHNIT